MVSGGWQAEVLVGRSGAGVGLEVLHVDTEKDLLNELVRLVNMWDPDILVGYEVRREMVSLPPIFCRHMQAFLYAYEL